MLVHSLSVLTSQFVVAIARDEVLRLLLCCWTVNTVELIGNPICRAAVQATEA